ncbi:MAG: bifunctional YncE family protein/alkaline phosphatase family protein [Terriglobales bacterium]
MKTPTLLLALALLPASLAAQSPTAAKIIDLPSNERLAEPAPGAPQRLDSFPSTLAVSPDGRYLAILNEGFGTQSIAVLDMATDRVRDYADPRLDAKQRQSYFLGLAFSPDGSELFASLASLTDPLGRRAGDLGNGILVYRFHGGALAPERFIPIPLQRLAAGHRATGMGRETRRGFAVPYPAGLAVFQAAGGLRILVADNLSDDALLLDATTGQTLESFDLSVSPTVPAAYPYAVAIAPDHRTAYCSLWNASRVAKLDLTTGRVAGWLPLDAPASAEAAGSHPSALLLSRDGRRLYVALANADRVAAVSLRGGPPAWLDTTLPGERYGGSTPNALAESPDGHNLFVADASLDAVAVFGIENLRAGRVERARGFIPTEWYPVALATARGALWIAAGKGQSTGPNGTLPVVPHGGRARLGHPYIGALLHGSIARLPLANATGNLGAMTSAVKRANLMEGRLPALPFRAGHNPIRHVIYIIKENRTYDQILGDLGVGNGDPSLTLYGAGITPNQHALARRFGVLDNFYDSGEVSGGGHVWSMAAITSDYTEKTWQIGYRNDQRSYDYEGTVAGEVPLEHGIADVDEPGSGYIWANVARHGLTHRNYGEYVETQWCDERATTAPPEAGAPPLHARHCPQTWIEPGQPLLGAAAGEANSWPWRIPIIARDVASKRELVGHFDPDFADFRLDYPDQLRADEFLREFRGFVTARKTGHGKELPQFVILRLPDDHTMGTRAGGPTPEASVADNDLAVGRVVDAISHSPYWDDTALIILEDDAQDGADHVDAHRSTCLVISKYSPSSAAHPFVDDHFYTTVNAVRTMEVLLGLPPMNHNDARAAVMAPLFGGSGTQPPFDADYRDRDNGLIYRMNPAHGPGARASAAMDWRHADANPAEALDAILWHERKGNTPRPAPRFTIPGLDAPATSLARR